MDKGKNSPKENKHAGCDSNFFSQQESNPIAEFPESQVKKNVVPSGRKIQARRLTFFNELREPGVVNVAAEVASFDVAVPEARQDQGGGDDEDTKPESPDEGASSKKP